MNKKNPNNSATKRLKTFCFLCHVGLENDYRKYGIGFNADTNRYTEIPISTGLS